jgi:central kinetochore subunit Mal2/MCM21
MNVSKDGRVEKAVCRARDGNQDVSVSRKAIGPMVGLIWRLNA